MKNERTWISNENHYADPSFARKKFRLLTMKLKKMPRSLSIQWKNEHCKEKSLTTEGRKLKGYNGRFWPIWAGEGYGENRWGEF